MCFFTDADYNILPRSIKKNKLHKALESKHFDDASRLILFNSESYLVECYEGIEKSYRSCLHTIAAMSDKEGVNKLCKELLEAIKNAANREYLLNMTTVDQFDMGGWSAYARVAAIHIAAYNGNAGIVKLLCQEYGVDVNCSTSETLEDTPKKASHQWNGQQGMDK